MATNPMSDIIEHLRRAVLLRDGAGLTDGQLLADYLSRRDEAALAALVRRHGPMVWGVCRRVLGNYHDAEDAFQASFLVLVRKAASIASRELLANWLYGVALQTALKARATAARRRARERQVTEMPEAEVVHQDLWNDLQPLLDHELSRLPDKYRVPIVLCNLEGKTRKEAARQLGCPEGTVAGRLARARVMLAKRLARHGMVLSGGALATMLAQNVASAGLPVSVVSSTIQAASLFAAGQAAAAGAISAKVAALTEGVLKTMFLTKLKLGAVLMLILGVCAVGVPAYQRGASETGGPQPAAKVGDRKATLQPATLLKQAREAANGIADDPSKLFTLLAIAEAQMQGADKTAATETFREAIQTAKQLPDEKRAHFLTNIVGFQAKAGDFKGARETAATIVEENQRDFALASIGLAQARAGDIKGAVEAAKGVSATQRATLLGAVAVAQAAAGKAKEAAQTVSAIDGDYPRALALLGIAKAHVKAKDGDDARKSLQEALQLAERLDLKSSESVLRTYVAEVQARMGDVKQARQTADAITEEQFKELALGHIVKAQAAAGDFKSALQTADAIKGKDRKGVAVVDVITAQLRLGDVKAAQQTAVAVRGTDLHYVKALGEIAKAQMKAGGRVAAAETFKKASESVSKGNVAALSLLAQAQAEAGEEKEAFDWVVKLSSPLLKAQALLGIVRGMALRKEAGKRSQEPRNQGPPRFSGGKGLLWLKSTVAFAQQEAEGAVAAVSHHDVGLAVAVEIRHGHGIGQGADSEGLWCWKVPSPLACPGTS